MLRSLVGSEMCIRDKPSSDPGAPTQADRDAHAATHLPFRSWCDECVQGRRDAPPHFRQKRAAGEIPK